MNRMERRETWVGRSIRRVEDPALVTGRGRFTADVTAAHWVRFVRSSVAAGRIERITAPEGATLITVADLIGVKPIRPMLQKFGYVPIDQPILASQLVRFVGEPIAAVIAASEEEAEDVADSVEVAIAQSRAVIRAEEALAEGAALVHEGVSGNVIIQCRHATADFDAAQKAAHRLISVEVRSRRQNAMPLEARGGHAAYDPGSGRIVLTCSTQTPHLMRTAIADLIGMPESQLRVIAPDVGGGFGQKMSLPPEYVLLVWLAQRLKSSVAWREDRRENLIASASSSRYRPTSPPTSGPIPASRRPARSSRSWRWPSCRDPTIFAPIRALRAACSPTPARWRPIVASRVR
jgi:carbon-monoxide dehydrogenase large subunit